jgi:hypothetical protein
VRAGSLQAVRRLVLPLVAAFLVAAPAAHGGVVVGLAEQKASVFDDPFFQRLMLRTARLHVGWDVLHNPWELQRTDAWLQRAREHDIEPLITFGRSRIDHRRHPTPARFAAELRAFRERWPFVRRFATWNEVNHRGQPTLHRPALAVRWWRALRRACPSCTVLPAELLDTPNMLAWVRRFLRRARTQPAVWGVHPYAEGNRLRTTRMRALLRIVVNRLGRRGPSAFEESPRHAARVVRFLLRRVVRLSPRIERVYVYNWDATGTGDAWDSALLDARGRPRPAWYALLRELARLRTKW